jgi:hypothetical protein
MTNILLDQTRLMEEAVKGVQCPHCGQLIKIYKRRLNAALAHALLLISQRLPQREDEVWFHVPTFLASQTSSATIRGGDWAKLVYWELIEPMPAVRTDGSKRSGYYRITTKGIQFAADKITLPKYAYVYNQTLYGLSDGIKYPKETTTIKEALGTKFNYGELMGHTPDAEITKRIVSTLTERIGPQRSSQRSPKGNA